MTTLELFNKAEEALNNIGLSLDDFYSLERSTVGLRLQGKYSEKIVKALTPEKLSINKHGGWVVAEITTEEISFGITLTW